jgi:SAM-dependent methyltransferase
MLLKSLKSLLRNHNQSARDTWVATQLKSLPDACRLLDAGAGEQRYRAHCAHLEYVSQDFGGYDGNGDGTGLQTGTWNSNDSDILSDICQIPEPDASFDAILCTEVLEHLPEPITALREFRRLLKPNGILILTAPFTSLTHFAPYHFYSGFNHYFYEKWLPELGFSIRELSPNGNYFDVLKQELLRTRSVVPEFTNQPGNLNIFQKGLIYLSAIYLARMSKHDRGSHELQCFGYHVRAVLETGRNSG